MDAFWKIDVECGMWSGWPIPASILVLGLLGTGTLQIFVTSVVITFGLGCCAHVEERWGSLGLVAMGSGIFVSGLFCVAALCELLYTWGLPNLPSVVLYSGLRALAVWGFYALLNFLGAVTAHWLQILFMRRRLTRA